MKRLLLGLFFASALATSASAHVLDEYLQAAQVALATDGVRVELRLTPGVELADRVFALIDLDRDREISTNEEQAYARRVLQDLSLKVDDQTLPLTLTKVVFPSRSEMKQGDAAIILNFVASKSLSTGEHQLSLLNTHLPIFSVYQANTLIPASNKIKITSQQRDPQQHELRVQFHLAPDSSTSNYAVWPGTLAALSIVLLFLRSLSRS